MNPLKKLGLEQIKSQGKILVDTLNRFERTQQQLADNFDNNMVFFSQELKKLESSMEELLAHVKKIKYKTGGKKQ